MHAEKNDVFERMRPSRALAVMALPTVASQVIILLYNLADTWFIGRTGNPYMIAASSLALTVYLATTALANVFGTGGGSLMARLIGEKKRDYAKKVASYSVAAAATLALVFSMLVLILMKPLLTFLGASDNTLAYAKLYVLTTTVAGGIPTVLSMCMPQLLRSVGYSREAGIGVCLGMVPLLAYNYGAKNQTRMKQILSVSRRVILRFSCGCVLLFWLFAKPVVGAFLADEETVLRGAAFLRGRCFALPLMLIGYHIVNYMNAVNRGKVSFLLSLIRHIALIIPVMLAMNALWGLTGLTWSQLTADLIHTAIACCVFQKVDRQIVKESTTAD